MVQHLVRIVQYSILHAEFQTVNIVELVAKGRMGGGGQSSCLSSHKAIFNRAGIVSSDLKCFS
jgi:hypothetical protein